ncbi:MAG: GNAT family N-acetyltransferase [Pseudomonadota bacterium]
MRNYTFRTLTKADLPLMQRWLSTAHVKVWWPDAEAQVARMERDMNSQKIAMFVVCLIKQPFAYLHDHDARAFDMPEFSDLPTGARVMSTFVGDKDFMGQGHSVGYIDAWVREIRLRYPMVATAPNTTNTREISVFRKAGFQNRRLASNRKGQLLQVMTHL